MSTGTPTDGFIGLPESIEYPDADTTECGPNLCERDNDSAYPVTNGGDIICTYDTAGYVGQPVVLDCIVFAARETSGVITADGTTISEFTTKCEPKTLTPQFVPQQNTTTVRWRQTGDNPVYLDSIGCDPDFPQAPLREGDGIGAGLADPLGAVAIAGSGVVGFVSISDIVSVSDVFE